jgi:hypothetical protein
MKNHYQVDDATVEMLRKKGYNLPTPIDRARMAQAGWMPRGPFALTKADPFGWTDPDGAIHGGCPAVAALVFENRTLIERIAIAASRRNGTAEDLGVELARAY